MGLGFLIFSIVNLDPRQELTNQARSWITLLAGVITEAVAALFFVQSNRARATMTEFFDRLRDDDRQVKAIALAQGVEDPQMRSKLLALLVLQFAKVSVAEDTLKELVTPQPQAYPTKAAAIPTHRSDRLEQSGG